MAKIRLAQKTEVPGSGNYNIKVIKTLTGGHSRDFSHNFGKDRPA
jgi:hypothetical protein